MDSPTYDEINEVRLIRKIFNSLMEEPRNIWHINACGLLP
jgi:hypothetical protein